MEEIKIWPEEEMEIKDLIIAYAKYNPRIELKPGMKKYKELEKSIKSHGLVDHGIVYNKRTNTLVGGHQRVNVMYNLGVKLVPTVIVDVDEYTEKAMNIMLNSEDVQGEWDMPKLKALIQDIQINMPKAIDLTALTSQSIDKILNGTFEDIADHDLHDMHDKSDEPRMKKCPKCHFEWE